MPGGSCPRHPHGYMPESNMPLLYRVTIGTETIFGWGAKVGEKQSRQSNSKRNFI